MSFNPDPAKQAEQVIFSTKVFKVEHPTIYFCGSEVETVPHDKHIGLILDETLNFAEHIKEAKIKARRGIGIIRFLSKYVHRDVLDQMYKLYMRPNLDYGDVVYHNQNSSVMSKLESTQYAAALAVSGAWRGTNTDKLFEELGWESLAYIGDGTEDFAYSIKLWTTAPLNIQEDIFPHLNKIHMIRGGQAFLLKNEQIQTDTRTISIRVASRLGTTLTQPFGIFLIFLSLKRHCDSL